MYLFISPFRDVSTYLNPLSQQKVRFSDNQTDLAKYKVRKYEDAQIVRLSKF